LLTSTNAEIDKFAWSNWRSFSHSLCKQITDYWSNRWIVVI